MNTRRSFRGSWSRAALGAARAAAPLLLVIASAARATTLFGLVDTGELFESADGTTWSVRGVLPVRDAIGLVAVSSSAELVLASESGTVYRSTDGGLSWSALATLPAWDVRAIGASGSGDVFLATASGTVFRDTGSGAVAVGAIPASNVTALTRLGIDTFVLAETGEVYRSGDEGVTWSVAGLLPVSNAIAIVALGGDLFALSAEGTVAKCSDLGATWTVVGSLSQVGMTSLLATTDRLYTTTAAGEVASSLDGTGWAWQGAINQLTVRGMAHDSPALGVDGPAAVARPIEFLPVRPNPTRGAARLLLDLVEAADVTIEVFDAAGRFVDRPLDHERLPKGVTTQLWRPASIAPGAYFVRARFGMREETQSVVVTDAP
jgi:hypothetical protein